MSQVRTWTLSIVALIALAAGVLLATGGVSFAQQDSPSPTADASATDTPDAGDTEDTTADANSADSSADDSDNSADDSDSADGTDDSQDDSHDGNCPHMGDEGTDSGTSSMGRGGPGGVTTARFGGA